MLRSSLFWLFLITLWLPSAMSADTPPRFTIEGESSLRLLWRDEPLIASDDLDIVSGDAFEKPEGVRREEIHQQQVTNIWKSTAPQTEVTWRRESVTDGKSIEMTVQFKIPAWYEGNPKGNPVYSIKIPFKTMEGASYVGSHSRFADHFYRGTFSKDQPDGPIGERTTLRYLALGYPDGRSLVLNFAPSGDAVFSNGGPTHLQRGWWVEKKGDFLVCSSGALRTLTEPHHGIWIAKLKIEERNASEQAARTNPHNYAYFGTLPAVWNLSFGHGTPEKRIVTPPYQESSGGSWAGVPNPFDEWQPTGKALFSSDKAFGWEADNGLNLLGDAGKSVLNASASSTEPHVFRFSVPQPGLYLFTLRTHASDTGVGPWALEAQGDPVADEIRVEPGEIKTLTFARYLQKPEGAIRLSGKWSLSTLAAQPLLYESEDTLFARTVWVAKNIPTPADFFPDTKAGFPMQASVQSYLPHPAAAAQPATGTDTLRPVVAATHPDPPELRWRYYESIMGLGPGNAGSFHEFESDEQIIRRLDELKATGYRTMIVNGLLFRLGWPREHQRVKENLAKVVRHAHQRGMKVIDHFDVSVVPHQGTGYEVWLNHLDWALRDVRNGQVSRGYCINNPHFQSYFFGFLQEWVDKTGVDGLMLDEVAFHNRTLCGCTHCRAKFHRDTGLTLPLNENDPHLLNQESPLWKQWLVWRNQSVGDFFVDVEKQMRAKRSDFVLMYYSAPIGFGTSIFTRRTGGTITDAARGCNYLGTESISRNVHATWRSNFANRAIFQSLRQAFDTPIFNLVYPAGDPTIAYAGWIMNHMFAQPTWSIRENNALSAAAARQLGWKHPFDYYHAKQVADIAVVLSQSSRDFSASSQECQTELLGLCQQLGDHHLPYEVILDIALTPERLAPYRLVILPHTTSLSDQELATLKTYVKEGGTVLATGLPGIENHLGERRAQWPIGDWLGLTLSRKAISPPLKLEGELVEPETDTFPFPAAIVHPKNRLAEGTSIAATFTSDDTLAVAEKKAGKGHFLLIVPQLGQLNMEKELQVHHVFETTEHSSGLLYRWLTHLLGDQRRFVAVSMPKGVALTHFEQSDAHGNRLAFIHLYNGTGSHLSPGQRIPQRPPHIPFPALKEDLVFEVTPPGKGRFSAMLSSPETDQTTPLDATPTASGRLRITVPRTALTAYGMVTLSPAL